MIKFVSDLRQVGGILRVLRFHPPIKYNKSTYREAIVITNFKNELRSNIQMMIKNPEVPDLYIMKLELLLNTL